MPSWRPQGLYLFGFTYLYVGISNLAGFEPEGIGWFSLFVACAALVVLLPLFHSEQRPSLLRVIWLAWAALWTLFFLVLGLGRENLSRFTGWAAVLLSQPTCTVPAFLILTDNFHTTPAVAAGWAGALLVLLGLAKILAAPKTAVPQSRPSLQLIDTTKE